MQRRDPAHDRDAQAAPAFGLPLKPVKSLAQTVDLRRCQGRSVVIDFESILREAERHRALSARIAHRVVEEIAKQDDKQVRISDQRQGMRASDRPLASEFDMAAFGERQRLAHGLLDDGRPCDLGHRREASERLDSR